MSGKLVSCVVILSFVCVCFGIDFPNHFNRCLIKDGTCLNQAIEGALHYLSENGLPEFDIPKLDPIEIPEINIGTKGNAVQVFQRYTDVKVTGFKLANVSRAHINWDKKFITFITTAPKFDQISHYDIKGRLLIFPIFGNGTAVLTQMNCAVLHRIQFEEEAKEGQNYWKVISYNVNMKPERISFKFDNLFNGNKLLSDRVHIVVNENWQALWLESKKDFENIYGQIYMDFANKLFTKLPIDSIFKL